MKRAADDADRDLALALAERIAGAEMRPERPHHLRQLGVVHIDLVRAGQPTARLNQRAIGILLLRGHLLIGNLGITSERGGLGHGRSPRLKQAVGTSLPAACDHREAWADMALVQSIGKAVHPGKEGHRAWAGAMPA